MGHGGALMRGAWTYKDGKLVEKDKAAPELLREDLRKLPSDMVTKDADDEQRIHAEDPPHIQKALTKEARHRETGFVNPFDPANAPRGPELEGDHRLEQWKVDLVALKVKRAWANTQKLMIRMGRPADRGVKWLWFPRDDIRAYEMRDGNPPPDSLRPKRLRGLNLVVDINDTSIPETLFEILKKRQIEVDALWKETLVNDLAGKDEEPELYQ